MSFNKYDTLLSLNESKEDWIIRVRAQSIWKGINRQNGEFRGYNIIFFDDSSDRIHAFISSEIAAQLNEDLTEAQIYTVQNFKVKVYIGDETNRPIRNDKHLYFTKDTELKKDDNSSFKIPHYSFDLFRLEDMEAMKVENRFLTDVVAVIQYVQTKAVYIKDGVEKSHVPLTITDGKNVINVTFFNEFGDSFLKAWEKIVETPVIIIIGCAKVSDWKGALYLTNFPATRFYLNVDHFSVNSMRKRLTDPKFYMMDIDDEDDSQVPCMKVSELRNLKEDYIEKKVICQLTVKKVDEKMNWYIPICTQDEKELTCVDDKYKCECGRNYPYPDRRFQLYTLCCDDTGTIPVVWPNDEICRITGKTVYDVEVDETQVGNGDKFPQMLKFCDKKMYKFTICVTKENIKERSNVYKASHISEPMEISATHSPNAEKILPVTATQTTIETDADEMTQNSPPTAKSSNKIRPRINLDDENVMEEETNVPNFKNVKIEKR